MKVLSFILLLICSNNLLVSAQNSLSSQAAEVLNKEITTRKAVKFKKAASLYRPGKIYLRGDILYVNDKERGLHVYDNTDPSAPRFIRFVEIAGNYDIAMKDNILYADSYNDLLAIDMNSQKTTRIRDVFSTAKTASSAPKARVNSAQQQSAAVGGGALKAGSMARFAISGNYLYVIDKRKIKVFNISQPEAPQEVNSVSTLFVVETLYPVDNLLFVGGTEGVYIYDISTPANPQQQSIFQHALGCDPVVVQDGIAYITLRAGTNCNPNGKDSRLDIVNVENPKKPVLISSHVFKEPRGLDVYNNHIYLCNNNSLEVYALNESKTTLSLVKKVDVPEAYDVIYQSDNNRVLAVGEKGIYQFQHVGDKVKPLGTLVATKAPAVESDNAKNPSPFKNPTVILEKVLTNTIKLPNLGF